ncbi:MAG TPA: hypothetical protein VMX58_02085 [Patescibacteria group bacterium]|nr:hypothetical protein [Patescibacteria group bacterium]
MNRCFHRGVDDETIGCRTHYISNIPVHFWRDMSGTLGIASGILVMLGTSAAPFARPSGYPTPRPGWITS